MVWILLIESKAEAILHEHGELLYAGSTVLRGTSARDTICAQSMNRRSSRLARIGVAALLAIAFLSTTVPLATVSAGSVCRLECCAARATHAAGSCMNGTCHAGIKLQRSKLRVSLPFAPTEQVCGLQRLIKQPINHAAPTGGGTDGSVAKLVAPCDADCGICGVSPVSAKEKLAVVAAYRLQPAQTSCSIPCDRASSAERSQPEYSPRGPPLNLT